MGEPGWYFDHENGVKGIVRELPSLLCPWETTLRPTSSPSSRSRHTLVHFPHNLGHVLIQKLAMVDLKITADVNPIDIAFGGNQYKVCVGVLEHSAQLRGVDHQKVRELAGFQTAEFVFDA